MAQLVSLTLIHWIVIYPVDSAIQLLNNWGLIDWKFDSPNQKHYLDLGGDASLVWNFRARFSDIRDFKIQRRGRQRERRLKSEFAFFQPLQRLFLPTYFVKCRRALLKLSFK